MSVLDHIDIKTQVWDGLSFTYVPEAEAKKLAKAGTHQITKNLQAHELKTAAQFNEAREKKKTKAKPKNKALMPGMDGKQSYKTREMKAE